MSKLCCWSVFYLQLRAWFIRFSATALILSYFSFPIMSGNHLIAFMTTFWDCCVSYSNNCSEIKLMSSISVTFPFTVLSTNQSIDDILISGSKFFNPSFPFRRITSWWAFSFYWASSAYILLSLFLDIYFC